MEREWSCYGGLNEGEWSCSKDGQFNRGRKVIMEVASLKKGEWLI